MTRKTLIIGFLGILLIVWLTSPAFATCVASPDGWGWVKLYNPNHTPCIVVVHVFYRGSRPNEPIQITVPAHDSARQYMGEDVAGWRIIGESCE